jgi:hypothetical protein
MEKIGTGAGRFDLSLQIGSARQLTFIFRTYNSGTGTYTDDDISGKTFVFFIKKFKGSRKNIVKYTNQSGITIPIYYTNRILVNVLAADVSEIEEGEYYWELRREDLDQPRVYGLCFLTFDAQ